jgi:UDP-N-acetylmuramyl pentapeptide phosphotransferase/UDP-N-acetylglucosamine-1-phosphate transferase
MGLGNHGQILTWELRELPSQPLAIDHDCTEGYTYPYGEFCLPPTYPKQKMAPQKGAQLTILMLVKIASGLFFGCLVAAVALIPLVMRFARKIDAVDRGGYRKVFEGAMPLLGGLGVALPLVVLGIGGSVTGFLTVWGFDHNWVWVHTLLQDHLQPLWAFAQYRGDLMILTTGGLGILALGLWDDTRGMRARWKLLGQIAVASFVCFSGYALTDVSIPVFGPVNLGIVLGSVLAIFWIVGMINAFNLIDGVDGLASGIALVGVTALAVLGVIQGNAYVTLVGASLAGCLLGFLFYNFPPARIFLGDTGSMFIGYTLAAMSLMGSQKYATSVILLTPMLALSFPIFETLISIIRRYLRGVPIFAGDNHHTHHRLLGKGYSHPRVVLTLYLVAISLAAAAVLSAVIPISSAWSGVPYALYAGTLVYIAWLAGYLRPTAFRTIFERRQKNRLFHALANYAKQCLDNHGRCVERRLLLQLCRHELGLQYIDVRLEEGGQLMASDGAPQGVDQSSSAEVLRVKSSDDRDVFVRYAYVDVPSITHRHDVIACLAGIFDQTVIDHEANRVEISLADDAREDASPDGLPVPDSHST